ncbi:unnamed protein product [Clonostachys rosea f. rosea IK726]|uniref:Zn(2)-C6 fungal-type domain-containing protein n=2 Tax=Bionectria ochroleuca TaxID=29856 RepID=A0A0B7JQI2_BIOOC|nr:unnamed protein product [Clonostachys rosea f. rosea IK726]
MVYCGKPSKGCSNCRERKVRCDQREPECGQCEKREQKCPGYRNMVDLMFRDESSHVIKKATRTTRTTKSGAVKKPTKPEPIAKITAPRPPPKQIHPSQPYAHHEQGTATCVPSFSSALFSMLTPSSGSSGTSPSSNDSDNGDILIDSGTSSLVLQYPLTHSLQERGTAFFFSRYVAVDFGCYQNYDFVYDVWKPPKGKSEVLDCVTASMTAVGLAGLSKITRSHDMMVQSRQSYGTALQLTNAALQNPAEAVSDGTMLAVLVLGTYEFITGRTPQTMGAWKDHVNGAAALTRMRGATPFRTKAGTRMFLMLCHSVLITCIQAGLPMPQAMLDLRNELGQYTNTKDPTWRMFEPICRALQIRNDIKQKVLKDTDEIVAKLADVENEFATLVSEMPRVWHYRSVQVTRPNSAILSSWCHLYRGFAQATTWNGMRTMRMLVQETILEQLCSSMARTAVPPMRHQILLVKSMRMLELLGDSIIASVPQHFGVISFRDAMAGSQCHFVPTTDPPQRIASACPIPSPRPPRHRTPESPGGSPRPTLLDPTQSDDGRGDPERFMTLASASNTIVWPLYTLGMSSSCTRETRQYIIERLDAIYVETGLDQARTVKLIIQARVESPPWEDIPMNYIPAISDETLPIMV